ncbi:MAG TPA: glycosyltransferase [Gammaproteobacteria bacterium]|nr:glycosyltransferase [Gammaproteobacteria bacterium]
MALVIPWYGEDQPGGAERQAREVAMRLAKRGHQVEVFTTCSRSFQSSWSNDFFAIGEELDAGVRVHRFPVDHRREGRFNAINKRLLELSADELLPGIPPVGQQDEDIFVNENINSTALVAELKQQAKRFDAVLFTPYLYGTTLNGLPQIADKAFLIPCLHDEAYAYLPVCAHIFRSAKGILYLSEGEELLAHRLYGPAIATKGFVVGSGVELFGPDSSSQAVDDSSLPQGPFVLVLGRRDATKNTDLVVQAFKNFRKDSKNSSMKLVLAGPGPMSYDDRASGVHDLGLVDDSTKLALLRAATALFQPSKNESYSRVMMEGWACRKPVVVNGDCDATAIAVDKSGGGFSARTLSEWTEAFCRLEKMPAGGCERLGCLGHDFARSVANWDSVISRYESFLGLCEMSEQSSIPPRVHWKVRAIHQVLPNLAYGDAISDSALTLRDFLRRRGVKSNIFVQFIDKRMAHQAEVFQANLIHAGDGLVYHHSIGSALTPYVVEHNGPRVLNYHNITPPRFFEPYDEDFARLLSDGLDELHNLASSFDSAWGVSQFNVKDLFDAGFNDVHCLPLIVDPAKWAEPADEGMMRALREDGRKNILFVGRLAPNKCQHDLVEMISALTRLAPDARLCIVGDGEADHPYVQYVTQRISSLGLENDVLISGQVSHSVLQAFYRTADVYVSMSEHEGFGVPLIEAMWFDVPVVAFKSSAIPETLGDAAVMFTSKQDMDSIAALIKVILTDVDIRRRIRSAQRRNRERFTARQLEPLYEQLIGEVFQ